MPRRCALSPITRLDMGRGIALAQGAFYFLLDGAGDVMRGRYVNLPRKADVKVHPMIPAAVAVTELMVIADLRELAIGSAVAVENGGDLAVILHILPVHDAAAGLAQ